MEDLQAPLEALLFARGEPVTMTQLQAILQVDAERLEEVLELLKKSLEARKSGLMLHCVAGGYQLVTRPEYHSYVEKLAEVRDRKLSMPTLETLSIIAFKQPITKQEIEHIRGVRVERALQKLLEMEFIEEVGRRKVVGRPILYGTTDVFLKSFGLNALSDLPALPSLEDVVQENDAQFELLAVDETSSQETAEDGLREVVPAKEAGREIEPAGQEMLVRRECTEDREDIDGQENSDD